MFRRNFLSLFASLPFIKKLKREVIKFPNYEYIILNRNNDGTVTEYVLHRFKGNTYSCDEYGYYLNGKFEGAIGNIKDDMDTCIKRVINLNAQNRIKQ